MNQRKNTIRDKTKDFIRFKIQPKGATNTMFNYSKLLTSIVFTLFCLTSFMSAQTSASPTPTPTPEPDASATQAPVNPYKGKFLFGDWGGSRQKMAAKGVNWDISFTQFGQTISGERADDFDYYGNRVDVFLNIDTEKAGMWKGGGIGTHIDYRYGNSPKGVNLFPANGALFTPSNGERKVAVTSLYLTQKIGKSSLAMVGKINPLDSLASAPFIGGRGVDGFMHIAFAGPVSGVTPVSTYGLILKTTIKKKYGVSVFVYDPTDQTGWHKPFTNGVNVNFSTVIPSKTFGHNATHSFGVVLSTSTGTNLSDIPQVLLPPGLQQIGTKKGPWNLDYAYEQYFYQNPKNPAEGWGMFLRLKLADGNPNIIQNTITIGLGGTSLFKSRKTDRFGIGFFTYGLSNALKDALRPVLNIRREFGAEAFYRFSITPWLHITPDLQVLPPTIVNKDTRVFFAVRTKINF